MARTCPPAPVEACQVLSVAAEWWQIQLNPNSRLLDKPFEHATRTAIDSADRWTAREPGRAEAWFYLAGSYAPLVQWRVLRGARLSAAREGKKIKNALERALALDPTLQDAHFGIGLYHYYADVVPAAFKLLRWMLLLPGGDREQGLREMLQAKSQGVLLHGEIDFQLHWLYLWYEHQPERALELLRGLDQRYPSNPIFVQRIAEVLHEHFHDHSGSAAAWQTLLDRERDGLVKNPRTASAHLQLGAELEHLGRHNGAVAAYTRAMTLASADDPDNVRVRAGAALKRVRASQK
jgi:tetratricopeptide (TPR) repeat protein